MPKKTSYKFSWGNIQTMQTIENYLTRLLTYPDNPWNFFSDIIEFSRGNRIQAYDTLESFVTAQRLGKMFLNKKRYEACVSDVERDVGNIWKYYTRLGGKDFENITDKDLIDLFNEGQDHWQRVVGYFGATQEEGTHALIHET